MGDWIITVTMGDDDKAASRGGQLATFLDRHRQSPVPARFSTVLRLLGEEPGERFTVFALVDTFEDRVFGALMFIFAIPNVVPLPPGSSIVLGVPLLLISAQLAFGRRTVWLPAFVGARTIARADFSRVLGRILPHLRWVERILMPRHHYMYGAVGDRLIGAACFVLAFILLLPIPFGNMVPGLAIALFSLGLLQRDGLAAIAAWLLTVMTGIVIVVLSGALWLGLTALLRAILPAS